MASKPGFHQLKLTDRLQLEALLKANLRVVEIAEILKVHRSTIYNEIKRGKFEHLNSDYTTEIQYAADVAQKKCDDNMKMRGTQLKIGNDLEYANYLESKILNDGYSPAAVLGELKATGKDKDFKTTICVATFYSYIDKGIFLGLTNKDLPVKKDTKRPYHKVKKTQARRNAGESIEKRPEEIDTREEFGHWEMDSVIGQRGKSKNALVVLSERKTRNELVFKVADHSANEVVKTLDLLEKKWGDMFSEVFKTITVDNGSEFAFCTEMETSVDGESKRTKMYYCHPYSSWERGTNENINRMIRRKIPKGSNFDDKTDDEIQAVEDWINDYPRRILNYHTSRELFEHEVDLLMNKKTA